MYLCHSHVRWAIYRPFISASSLFPKWVTHVGLGQFYSFYEPLYQRTKSHISHKDLSLISLLCLTGRHNCLAHWDPRCVSPPQMTDMYSPVRLWMLGLLLSLYLGGAPARRPRTADEVSEAEIQRLLHGVMEQLGIARPRVEYPAHQATNIVGPQSIQGILLDAFHVSAQKRKTHLQLKLRCRF